MRRTADCGADITKHAIRPMVECLEQRRMLADVAAGQITVIEWHGQQVRVEAGEWLITYQAPEPTRDSHGEIVESNIRFNSTSTPSPEIKEALSALPFAVVFEKYLGVEHAILVKVATDAPADDIEAVLERLPGAIGADPNLVGQWSHLTPNEPYVYVNGSGDTVHDNGADPTGDGSGTDSMRGGSGSDVFYAGNSAAGSPTGSGSIFGDGEGDTAIGDGADAYSSIEELIGT